MNATLRISVFAQTTGSNNRTLSGVELIVRDIDSADIPVEFIDNMVVWHGGISVSYDEADRTLTVEKPADAKATNFDALVGTQIAGLRKKLAITSRANKNVLDRNAELNVTADMVDAIIAQASGYIDDTLADLTDTDALGKLLDLTDTDFGATDLFTEGFPLDLIDPQGAAQLV